MEVGAETPHIPNLNFAPIKVYYSFKNTSELLLEKGIASLQYPGLLSPWSESDTIKAARIWYDYMYKKRLEKYIFSPVSTSIYNLSGNLILDTIVRVNTEMQIEWINDYGNGKLNFCRIRPELSSVQNTESEIESAYTVTKEAGDGSVSRMVMWCSDTNEEEFKKGLLGMGYQEMGFDGFSQIPGLKFTNPRNGTVITKSEFFEYARGLPVPEND